MSSIAKYPSELLGMAARVRDEFGVRETGRAREVSMAIIMDLIGTLKLERRGAHGESITNIQQQPSIIPSY